MSCAPETAPDFLLSRAHGSVRTQGVAQTFNNADAAIEALEDGSVAMVVGALPFRRDHHAALTVPRSIIREAGALEPHSYYRVGEGSRLNARIRRFVPDLDTHLQRVEAAVATIERTNLEKVVLARAVDIDFTPAVDPRLIAARLIDLSHDRDGFIADLSPAGAEFHQVMLVGSSPEVLIRKKGEKIYSFPLAGSAPRQVDPQADTETGQRLAESEKDILEHQFVTAHMREVLAPLCSELSIPARPQLFSTNEMWHLATPIHGIVRNPQMTALELAALLHPTPAICGVPVDAAEEVISLSEGDRRFYAGTVGWSDNQGNGEYMVAIRCAEVNHQGTSARAWSGGGIVEQSTPQEEVEETSAKLRTMLRALGIET